MWCPNWHGNCFDVITECERTRVLVTHTASFAEVRKGLNMTWVRDRVLLLDRDHNEGRKVCTWLRCRGWEAQTCGSQDEAMSMLQSSDYNILITELQFFDTTEFILVDWALTNCPDLSVILVTDAPFSRIRKLSFVRRVQFCVEKPINRQVLLRVLLALKDDHPGEKQRGNAASA